MYALGGGGKGIDIPGFNDLVSGGAGGAGGFSNTSLFNHMNSNQ